MNEVEAREIREAIDAADNALDHLRSARRYLDSAGNWGLLDMFGGGLISGLRMFLGRSLQSCIALQRKNQKTLISDERNNKHSYRAL